MAAQSRACLHRRRGRHDRPRDPRAAAPASPSSRSTASIPTKRKDAAARAGDDARRRSRRAVPAGRRREEAVALADSLGDDAPRFVDASTAHRVADGWVYGFAELDARPGATRSARRAASPIPAAIRPARSRCCGRWSMPASSRADFPITVNAVSGYSGGGKSMIEAYEAGTRRRSSSTGSASSTSTCPS